MTATAKKSRYSTLFDQEVKEKPIVYVRSIGNIGFSMDQECFMTPWAGKGADSLRWRTIVEEIDGGNGQIRLFLGFTEEELKIHKKEIKSGSGICLYGAYGYISIVQIRCKGSIKPADKSYSKGALPILKKRLSLMKESLDQPRKDNMVRTLPENYSGDRITCSPSREDLSLYKKDMDKTLNFYVFESTDLCYGEYERG